MREYYKIFYLATLLQEIYAFLLNEASLSNMKKERLIN